jgi:hypothetical protein
MAAAAKSVKARTGRNWSRDYLAFLAVQSAWHEAIKAMAPKPPREMVQALLTHGEDFERWRREEPAAPTQPLYGLLLTEEERRDAARQWAEYHAKHEEWRKRGDAINATVAAMYAEMNAMKDLGTDVVSAVLKRLS